jgi:hypothetical protein
MSNYTGTLPTAADGQRIYGADITQLINLDHAAADAWTDFSSGVNWTASGTAPNIGNGSIVGKYIQIGKTVRYGGIITMGSTTTFGSGIWAVSLPVPTYASAPCVGVCHIHSAASGGNRRSGDCISAGLTQLNFYAGSGGQVSPTTPFVFASGDHFRWMIEYEAP